MVKMDKTVLEFFAGIGLFRKGLESRDWRCVWANDVSPDKADTYRENFGGEHLVVGDVWDIDPSTIPTALAATVSFPCTDLSLAGNRKGLMGKQSGTVGAFFKILSALSTERRAPKIVVLENVVGLLTSHGGGDLRAIVQELNSLGYVLDLIQINAVHFLPQSRPRIFLVGIALDLAPRFFDIESRSASFLDFHSMLGAGHTCRPASIVRAILQNEDCHWGLRRLPDLPVRKTQVSDIVEQSEVTDGMVWSKEKVCKLLGQMSRKHLDILEEWQSSGKRHFGTVYRRVRAGGSRAELRSDGVAGCLRTPRGGSSKQILVEVENGKLSIRFMSAREYARLMGVPEDFVHSPNYIKALFGYGDAVCVPVIKWLDDAYLSPLADLSSVSSKHQSRTTRVHTSNNIRARK